MKSLFSHLLKYFFITSGFILSKLPASIYSFFARLLGSLFYYLWGSRRSEAEHNLRLAFPDKSFHEISRLAKASFCNLAITFFELFSMPYYNEAKLKRKIVYENLSLVSEVYSRGRGIIFLSGHFGNWELLAYSVGIFTNLPVTIIVKPQRNTYIDAAINYFRTSAGNRIVSMYSAARTIVSTLSSGGVIAMLADQAATQDKDFFVDFFSRPASTHKAVANIALRFNTPIIMGFSIRQSDGSYKVKLEELDHSDLANNYKDSFILTQRHVKKLEEAIRANPDHWSWMHRRWKHTPPPAHSS